MSSNPPDPNELIKLLMKQQQDQQQHQQRQQHQQQRLLQQFQPQQQGVPQAYNQPPRNEGAVNLLGKLVANYLNAPPASNIGANPPHAAQSFLNSIAPSQPALPSDPNQLLAQLLSSVNSQGQQQRMHQELQPHGQGVQVRRSR
jgi:hypothetical protein